MKNPAKEIRRFPREAVPKTEILQIRITDSEKEGFEIAALLAGISLSSWVRERLRLTAIRELEGAGRKVPFVPEVLMGGSTNARP